MLPESSTMHPAPPPAAPAPGWTPLTRIAFRFAFCYFMLYALGCGTVTVWEMVPLIGLRLEGLAAEPFTMASLWLARHVFHVHGMGAVVHGSGYGDRALDWIAAGVMVALALVATLVWSLLDRRRTQYRTLFAWLRFTLRLTLIVSMFVYGFLKIFPIQIGAPSLAVLNEPLGSVSPMVLLWTVLGFSHTYERVCGVAELCAGLLLLYRRTALLGTLLAVGILTNIVLFDFFFDVPVKLFASNLLLMALLLLAPDARALFGFFWSHRPVVTSAAWVPPGRGRGLRLAVLLVEAMIVLTAWGMLAPYDYRQYARESANERHPSALAGQWHLDAATLGGAPHPFLTGDGQPLADLFLEPSGRVTVRAADGTLWPGGRYDAATHALRMMSPLRRPLSYTIAQPDPAHLLLTPSPTVAGEYPRLMLQRVPLPQHYRLFERGFHLINEWGFER